MKLLLKPVLMYEVYRKREAVSWRQWGGLTDEKSVKEEIQRIERELSELSSTAEFPIESLPLSAVKTLNEVSKIKDVGSADVVLIYAAGGGENILQALISSNKPCIIFLRHTSGPLYFWYEVIHPIFLRKRTDYISQSGVDVDDIVVDDYKEILWRLRALHGLKNSYGKRIISIGNPSGWDRWEGTSNAPFLAKEIWKLDIKTVSYQELGERIRTARQDKNALKIAQHQAEDYLSQANISLHTEKRFVVNAFLLYEIFKRLMKESDCNAITVAGCMSTIIPIAETTACLPLSLLNDKGWLAFCESDFVVIPSGILLHHISGKPVFMNDPTLPHNGVVTLAHCTAPRKMDGLSYEETKIVTHFESDYGAAPKVEFRKGKEVTVIVPDFNEEVWMGFRGRILDSPFYPICRSQVNVEIEGNWRKLLREMKGFHWIMGYGDYLDEIGYALKKVGIEWVKI